MMERMQRDANYENALEEAEKERKEINYGNYLACLPSRAPFHAFFFCDVYVSGLWFDLFKFFLRYFLFFFCRFPFFLVSLRLKWQQKLAGHLAIIIIIPPPANNNLFSLICALTPSRLAGLH